jgi:hypothetical protein
MEQPIREEDPYEGVANWMKELAARKYVHSADRRSDFVITPIAAPFIPAPVRKKPTLTPKHVLASTMLVVSFLQYYFLDVMVQINSMHSVIVFAPSSPQQRNAAFTGEHAQPRAA